MIFINFHFFASHLVTVENIFIHMSCDNKEKKLFL